MSEKTLLTIFALFLAFVCTCMGIDSYNLSQLKCICPNTPSVSALDATHTKRLYADSRGYASSFIPEFCADKLGRRTNSKSSYLIER